jgi:aryl-alcohol dehydrogenase-like predicted oxidoreductase
MRYRPFGGSGSVVSAVSLRIPTNSGLTAEGCVALVHAALEQGINYIEAPAGDPEVLYALGEAAAAVERELLVLSLRLGGGEPGRRDFSAETLAKQITDALARTGLQQFDVAVLDDPATDELSPQALATMKAARASGRAKMIGVSGVDDAIDAYISVGAFDLLAIPFNLGSGWRERRRLNEASKRDMTVVGYDPWPEQFRRRATADAAPKGLLGRAFGQRHTDPLADAGTYAFLDKTPNWTSEEICLAYALTDVKIATVMLEPRSVEHLEQLAAVADRELPSGVSAQVEMARFGKESA